MPLEEFISYISQEKRTCRATKGHGRNTRFWFGGRQKQEPGEKPRPESLLGFLREGQGRAGETADDW